MIYPYTKDGKPRVSIADMTPPEAKGGPVRVKITPTGPPNLGRAYIATSNRFILALAWKIFLPTKSITPPAPCRWMMVWQLEQTPRYAPATLSRL